MFFFSLSDGIVSIDIDSRDRQVTLKKKGFLLSEQSNFSL